MTNDRLLGNACRELKLPMHRQEIVNNWTPFTSDLFALRVLFDRLGLVTPVKDTLLVRALVFLNGTLSIRLWPAGYKETRYPSDCL